MLDYERVLKKHNDSLISEVDSLSMETHLNNKFNFVRYYKIENNKIIIYFSYVVLSTTYSKELELKVLEKMKEQINTYNKKTYKFDIIVPSIWAFTAIFQYTLALINKNPLYFITGGLYTANSSISAIPSLKSYLTTNDLKKHLLFLENEELINKLIREKMIELDLTDEESMNLVPAFDAHVNINDIHYMNKKQIKELISGDINKETIYKLRKMEQ